MSGGHFNYDQYKIEEIATEVERLIKENTESLDGHWCANFSNETLEEFKNGLKALQVAAVYAQRIDWLVSCDDGEESFHRRLKEELSKLDWPS